MKSYATSGIILARTNFGEADRILTFLTSSHGKVRAIAKAVRKSKSKLAGGIELFSVSELTFIVGRGEISTLISSRLLKHYANIVKELERSNTAYQLMKRIDKATEDKTEQSYFKLLKNAFVGLDDLRIGPKITEFWFNLQLLKLSGHAPNLKTDTEGQTLDSDKRYNFDIDRMAFIPAHRGRFLASHIKFIKLGLLAANPKVIDRVDGVTKFTNQTEALIEAMLKTHTRALG